MKRLYGSVFGIIFLTGPAAFAAPAASGIIKHYEDMALAMYGEATAKAEALDKSVDALLAKPSSETLNAARDAWKSARAPYLQTEGFRFGNKIVDDWEGEVNSWPLDEGLIDYVDAASYGDKKDDNPLYTANIIANKKLRIGAKMLDATKIGKKLIKGLNSALDVQANVGSGYHAIEFLLWGQALEGKGPVVGNRPATDFDLNNCTGGNCDRRRDYLKAATGLLVDDLKVMVKNWQAGGAARKAIAAKSESEQLAIIPTGLGSLSYGELAGERMKLGVLLHDREEAQDCFSNNTHNAHINDQLGMIAIWNGAYEGEKKLTGPSMAAFAREKAPEAAKRLDDAMANALAKIKAIKDKADTGGMAYDQMLTAGNEEGNKLILDASAALVAQARALEAVVAALNLKINLEGSKGLEKLGDAGKLDDVKSAQ